MSIEDNEMINGALDAAEVDIVEEMESKDPIIEKVVEESKPDPMEDAAIAASLEKKPSSSSRKQVSDQVADVETEEPEQVTQAISMPTFWPAELKAAAAKASPEVLESFRKYDEQRTQWANRIAGEAGRGKEVEKRVNEVFSEPVREEMYAKYGIKDPFEATERLLGWNKLIENDPETAIIGLIQRNNISLETLADRMNGYVEEQPEEVQPNEEVLALKRELEEFKATQTRTFYQTQVDSFKNGNDSTGQVRKAFAEMYAPQIDSAFSQLQQNYPHLSFTEALDAAYEHVKGEVSKLHAKPADKGAIIANAKKAQAAASSVSGAPSSGVAIQNAKLKGKNFSDKIMSAIDESMDSVGL